MASKLRSCIDSLDFLSHNGGPMRVACSRNFCDREATSWLATKRSADDHTAPARMLQAVSQNFCLIDNLRR